MNPPRDLASCILANISILAGTHPQVQSRGARSQKSHGPRKKQIAPEIIYDSRGECGKSKGAANLATPAGSFCPVCFYRLASVTAASPNTHFASGVGLTRAASTRLTAPSVARSEPRTVHHGRFAAAVAAALMSLVCVYVVFITSPFCRSPRANARDVYVTTVTNAFRHYHSAVRARNPRIAAEPCSPPGITANAGRHTPSPPFF